MQDKSISWAVEANGGEESNQARSEIGMNPECNTSLEQRMASMAAELKQVRFELRALQTQRRPAVLWQRTGCFSGVVLLGVIVLGALTHVSIAQKTKEYWTGTATVLDAPVEIRGESGVIARFSEAKGHHGLEVYGPNGQGVAVGSDAEGGAIFLLKDDTTRAYIKADGFRVYRSGTTSPTSELTEVEE